MSRLMVLLVTLLVALTAAPSFAEQMRVFVAGMDAVGVTNRDEMKVTVQTLLASRLSGAGIVAVGSAAEADAVVSGTYIAVGKMFSIDVIAKTTAGTTLTRAFVQGENQDELIPSVGKLAEKLSAGLVKSGSGTQARAAGTPLETKPAVALQPVTGGVSNAQIIPAPEGEFIKSKDREPQTAAGGGIKRLAGAVNLMAVGRKLTDGSREIFLAEGHRLAYYHQGSDMKLVAEAEFTPEEKIVSLDTITGTDGALDIYVTIIRAGEPASQVWQVSSGKLVLVAGNLPYFFRSASLGGTQTKLYAQSMGRDDDFYGDVAEVTRAGSVITLKNPLKMPRYGTIYSFNQFRDRDGKIYTVVINPDGYLIVFDQEQKELWRSNDKYGGSELFFQTENGVNARVTGDKYRWVFMNQRIQISSHGDIIVGKNDGFWVLGNARSYKRGAVYCFTWNGANLEEKWRTRETQNYMPDFYFDEKSNELLILQAVQRPGLASRGASTLVIKKVE